MTRAQMLSVQGLNNLARMYGFKRTVTFKDGYFYLSANIGGAVQIGSCYESAAGCLLSTHAYEPENKNK